VTKLEAATAELRAAGITAVAFPCDLSNSTAIKPLFTAIDATMGTITVLHWNVAPGSVTGKNLLTATVEDMERTHALGVTNLLLSIQVLLPKLQQAEHPAVLVTSGASSLPGSEVGALSLGIAAGAVAQSGKNELVGLLAVQLRRIGVFVGEVVIGALVLEKGPVPPIAVTGDDVGQAFWDVYSSGALSEDRSLPWRVTLTMGPRVANTDEQMCASLGYAKHCPQHFVTTPGPTGAALVVIAAVIGVAACIVRCRARRNGVPVAL